MSVTAALIKKKRDGNALTKAEIFDFINGFIAGSIADYQMSAMLMAIFFRGMTEAETAALTQVMLESGKQLDLSEIKRPKIDKHSTGGVGDKTSLLLAPILASLDVAVPMIAGRGLGHTGGTVDKLEAIPGFKTELSQDRFEELLRTVGVAMIAQSKEIAPADRLIYALRDVTATIDSVPLIVASIMSKKLAEDFDGLVLDVKTGNGAFMKDPRDAKTLAKALQTTGRSAGRSVRVVISDMSQPLGFTAGNAIEVNECVAFLRRGPTDPKPEPRLQELTLELAGEMLILARRKLGKTLSMASARGLVLDTIENGRAYGKFLEMVSMQGGDTAALDLGLPLAPISREVCADRAGFISGFDVERIGFALVDLGGGRKKAEDKIDPGVGIHFAKFLKAPVKKGDVLAKIYARDTYSAEQAENELKAAISVARVRPRVSALIRERL